MPDDALVLRRIPYGESSLVVHLLTREHGRVAVLAKGAYRPKSGYCGVLDLFDTLSVHWRKSRGGGLFTLAEASIERRRRGITRSLARYRSALSVLELAGLGALEGARDPAHLGLVEESLDLLDAGEVDPTLVLSAFDLRYLRILGLAPALDACATCGVVLDGAGRKGDGPAEVPFSVAAGGRLCPRCAARARGVRMLPLATLRIARSVIDATPRTIARTHLSPAALRSVSELASHFLEYHLETRPRTRAFAPAGRRRAKSSR